MLKALRLRFWLLTVGLGAAGGGGLEPAATPTAMFEAARGHLLIVGGGPRPVEIMQRVVQLAGAPGQARILVLPMASAVADEVGTKQAEELRALGAEARSLNLTRPEAQADTILRFFEGVTGIWFSGGDQNRLTAVLPGTPVDSAIRVRCLEGAMVGGTSAVRGNDRSHARHRIPSAAAHGRDGRLCRCGTSRPTDGSREGALAEDAGAPSRVGS